MLEKERLEAGMEKPTKAAYVSLPLSLSLSLSVAGMTRPGAQRRPTAAYDVCMYVIHI